MSAPCSVPDERLHRSRRQMSLKRAAGWSLIDQCLLSGTHFAIGLTVLRLAPKADYGVYVLSWSALMLLAGLHNAFINSQLTVRAAGQPPQQRDGIVLSFLKVQLTWYLPAAVAVLLGIGALVFAQPAVREIALAAGSVIVAFCGTALREFVRSVLMLTLDARRVLFVDIRYIAVLCALVAGCAIFLPHQWLANAVVGCLGAASLVAAVPVVVSILRKQRVANHEQHEFRDSLKHGFWAGGGVIVTHLQSQSSIYLLGIFAGVAITAEANAARQFLMPAVLAFTSLQRTLYPHWVALARAGNIEGIRRTARRFFVVASLGLAVYGTLLVVCSQTLIEIVLGPKYRASAGYIALFALLTWAETSRSLVSLQLQAQARFRLITTANAVTAALVIAVMALVLQTFEPLWSVLVQALGEVVLALLLYCACRGWRVHRRAQ